MLQAAYEEMLRDLEALPQGRSVELAFYGGTFTLLPEEWLTRFLEAAARYRAQGTVHAVRCSTRPDACDPDLLDRLKAQGLDTVELGVQSFHDGVLLAARRGHAGRDAVKACAAVKNAGLGLGVQLLPGLPGHTLEMFEDDIAQCVRSAPDMVRLHPCLVLAGTGLEALWRRGEFAPWPLEDTVHAFAGAVLALWRTDIAVTRIGLAPEPSLEEGVLAGPRHPALGTMVRAHALLLDIRERLDAPGILRPGQPPGPGGRTALRLRVPQRLSGEFFGHGRELAGAYAGLGLTAGAVTFEERDDLLLEVIQDE